MQSAAAVGLSRSAATRTTSQGSGRRTSVAAKLVAGIGAALTLAAVAAVITAGGPQTPASPIPSTSYSAVPNNSDVATMAPVATAPTPFVAAPAPAPAYAVAPVLTQRQCSLPQRKFYVAGNGTIRVHDGDFVSPPITLGVYAQEVVFPLSRPVGTLSPQETVIVEGRASMVVMTTDLPSFRQVFSGLRGARAFDIQWAPLRNC